MFDLFLTGIFTAAAKYRALVALALATWQPLAAGHPLPEAPETAQAIALAVLESPAGPYNDETEAALLAVFAWRESTVRAQPCLHSQSPTCGDSGQAHGYWQLHQAAGEDRAQRQAEVWLALLRYGASVCPERPLAVVVSGNCTHGTILASNRLKEALTAVQAWHAQQAAQAPERPAQASAPADPTVAFRATAVPPSAENHP